MADSSLEETKYHLILSADLGYLKESESSRLKNLCDEVGEMLYGLGKTNYYLILTAGNIMRRYHMADSG